MVFFEVLWVSYTSFRKYIFLYVARVLYAFRELFYFFIDLMKIRQKGEKRIWWNEDLFHCNFMLNSFSGNAWWVWASKFDFNHILFCTSQRRYSNRPLVEFEIAAQEQMKITELRYAKLFSSRANGSSTTDKHPAVVVKKAEGEFFFLDWLKCQSPTKLF